MSQQPASRRPPEPSLGRSSSAMALGTLASRGTGFLRTAVIAAAVGSALLGNAYAVANVTPNAIYELLLGGVLTSVVVPLLVGAARRGEAEGQAYAQRLLTVVILGLGALTIAAVLLAPVVIDIYAHSATQAQRDLTVTFARFFLPQIFFYGLGAVIGAILNTRGRFGPPMWAPVLNNVVVIVTGLIFLGLTVQANRVPGQLSDTAVLVLAVGTTVGIVVQTVALLPALRACGFRWRLRLDLRGTGLGHAASLAKWVLVYVAANQLGLIVITRLASAAADAARDSGGSGPGYASYQYAFQIFSLPHAIIAVSVITALLPRMSRAAVDGRLGDLRDDLSQGARLGLTALIPAAVAMIALHGPIATMIFGWGTMTLEQARDVGVILAAFAVGLVPFSLFQLQLRAFYALSDTRTPALLNIGVNAVNVAVDLILYAVLPPEVRVVGLALGYAASYAVGLVLFSRVLVPRLAGLDGYRVTRTAVRLAVASVLGGALAWALAEALQAVAGRGVGGSVLAVVVGAAAGGALFVLAAGRMRIEEVTALTGMVRSRLGAGRR